MSDLKSGSSHMRLIFKVKKGQLSKLLLLNRPIIMAILWLYIPGIFTGSATDRSEAQTP